MIYHVYSFVIFGSCFFSLSRNHWVFPYGTEKYVSSLSSKGPNSTAFLTLNASLQSIRGCCESGGAWTGAIFLVAGAVWGLSLIKLRPKDTNKRLTDLN